MSSKQQLKLPAKISPESASKNSKYRLRNAITDWLDTNKLGWSAAIVESHGRNFISLLCDVLQTLHFLPDPLARGDHYVPFEELYGVPTTERDRPLSKTTEGRGAHGVPFSPNNQTAFNVCQCVLCAECLRPRVLHSKHKLSTDDKDVLKRTLEDILYSCGSTLKNVKPLSYPSDSPQTKSIFERVLVRENLNCEMPMEVTYYSAECFEDLCVHCACNKELIFTTGVYPICSYCLDEGKQKIMKRKRPLFDASKASTKGEKPKDRTLTSCMYVYVYVCFFINSYSLISYCTISPTLISIVLSSSFILKQFCTLM